MSTSPVAKPRAPLPADVDEQAQYFSELEKSIADSQLTLRATQKELAAKELHLIELVRAFGGPHAEKSNILHGIVWEMVATFAQYTTQDAAAVERFRLALKEAKKTRLLKKIFVSEMRWTMRSSAAEIVKTEKLTPKEMALLLCCSVQKDKKPSLDVRQKKKTA